MRCRYRRTECNRTAAGLMTVPHWLDYHHVPLCVPCARTSRVNLEPLP